MSAARAPETDFLSRCAATAVRNPLLEEIHQRSSEVVSAVYRVVKIALVHDLGNDAVKQSVEMGQKTLARFGESVGRAATITYAHETVFVCGELLRATQSVYGAALELGRLLARCNVSELTFSPETTQEDLFAFAHATMTALRDTERPRALLEANIPSVKAKEIEVVLLKRENERDLDVRERALRAYASALLVLRQFFGGIATGATMLPHRVKRVAQRLVLLAEESDDTLLGITTLSHAQRDDAVRAVNTAILTIVLARQLTTKRLVLARLAMAALVADAGRVHVAGPERWNKLIPLPEPSERSVPPHAGALAFLTGGVNSASALRSVSAFETTWLERSELLGEPFEGRHDPLLLSQVLRTARKVMELVAPRDISQALSPFDALCQLAGEPWIDRNLLRVLVGAVGVFPVGTILELSTGEWAVVAGASEVPGRGYLPRVRMLTTSRGVAVDVERYIDLGKPADGQPTVARVVPPDSARFNVTRSFIE